MQALFRNPLAEPGLIGITAGGALGAVGAIVLTAGGFWITAPAAFAGSLLATLCAYAVGRRVPGVAGLLLAGVAITAVAFSLIGLLTFMANDAQLRDLTFWNMGSLARANWTLLAFLGLGGAAVGLMMTQWRAMNACCWASARPSTWATRLKRCACAWRWPARSSSARWSP